MFEEKMYGLLTNKDLSDRSFVWPALHRKGYEKNEDSLLQAIRDDKSGTIVHYAVIGLMEIGSRKSIPILKELVHYPKADVKTTSVVVIGEIAGANETKFYAHLLADPLYRDKTYPLTILWEIGDESAVPEMSQFAEKYLKSKQMRASVDPRYIKDYLLKYASSDEYIKGIIKELNTHIDGMKFDI